MRLVIQSDGAGCGTHVEFDGEPILDAVSVRFEAKAGEPARLRVTKADGTAIGWFDIEMPTRQPDA